MLSEKYLDSRLINQLHKFLKFMGCYKRFPVYKESAQQNRLASGLFWHGDTFICVSRQISHFILGAQVPRPLGSVLGRIL
jgi:hypothetical protein